METGTKIMAKRTLSKWSDIPHWPKEALEQHGKEDGKRKSQQQNQMLHLTAKVEIVHQPGYLQIKVEVTPILCFDPQQLWEQQDCRELSIPLLDTIARGGGKARVSYLSGTHARVLRTESAVAPARSALCYRELTQRTPPFWTPGRPVNSSYLPLTEVSDMAVGLETEVKVAKKADLKNLQDYKTVVEATDEGW